jgi:hypothetical protein
VALLSYQKRPKDAPKRPPSAFLNYCKKRRAELKLQHPGARNTDISKMLGEEWKNAPSEIRQPHIDKEAREREEYYKKVATWKENGSTNGKSGAFHGNNANFSVQVPPSLPTSASVAVTANRSPRALPTPPNELQKIVHSSMFQNPSLVEGVVSSISSWDGDASIDYTYAQESLMPTVLPPLSVVKFQSEPVLPAASRFLQNGEEAENLKRISSRKSS